MNRLRSTLGLALLILLLAARAASALVPVHACADVFCADVAAQVGAVAARP